MLQKRSLKNKSFPVITFKDGVLKKKKNRHYSTQTFLPFLPSGSKPGSTKNSGTSPALNMTMFKFPAQKESRHVRPLLSGPGSLDAALQQLQTS